MNRSTPKRFFVMLLAAALLILPAMSSAETTAQEQKSPTLTLIGHASVKIKTSEGVVIYIDPYYEGDYSEKADIILVSHEHSDHNKVDLCQQNNGCLVLRAKDTINTKDMTYNTIEYMGVIIQPVPAANKNHSIKSSTGFVLTFDGITIYHSGDTSKLDQMAALKERNIDYAFFPIDGKYNMDAAEAMECAALVSAKHNTPMHYFDADPIAFQPENLLPIAYGETVELTKE
jgi:L-ascorbate metabolism protein UlaG (beta-lactamase superfamily)